MGLEGLWGNGLVEHTPLAGVNAADLPNPTRAACWGNCQG